MNGADREQLPREAWQALRESVEARRSRRGDDLILATLQKLLDETCPANPASFQRSLAEDLMKHKDWKKRLAGLIILGWYCKSECQGDVELIAALQQISMSDSSEQVRQVALHTIGRLLELSRDAKLGRYRSTLVGDTSLPLQIRESAYVGLCKLHGTPLPIVHESGALLQQVDHAVIQHYLG